MDDAGGEDGGDERRWGAPEDGHEMSRSEQKSAVRARLRAERRAASRSLLAGFSQQIVERLLGQDSILAAAGVALFWPLAGGEEVDLRPLDAELRARGVPVFYPFMDEGGGGPAFGFRLARRVEDLKERGHRFFEPDPAEPKAKRGDVSVVLVPALGVTEAGDRIGYGGGYYDRALRELCPPAISLVVAYEFQVVDSLPTEPLDVRCDGVVTEARLHGAALARRQR